MTRDLHLLLDLYPADERPRRPPSPLGGAGGLSGSLLWRYTSSNGDRVVRAWPASVAPDRVARIHAWLGRLADLPYIPRPVPSRSGETFVRLADRCWEVAPWMPGSPATAGPADLDGVRAAFEALGEVHRRLAMADVRSGTSPGIEARCGEVVTLLGSGFDRIEGALEGSVDPLAVTARAWLAAARKAAPGVLAAASRLLHREFVLQPCLRDARPEHILFDGGRVSGLVDFGAMDVETVAADLARLAGEWFGPGEASLRREGLEAYRRIVPLGTAEFEAVDAFESLADLLIGERWARWRFLEGRRFEDAGAFREGMGRGLARAERLARRLGGGP